MKGGEEGDTGKQRTGGLGSFCSNLACKDRRSRKDRIGLQGSAIQCKNRRSIEIKDEKLRRKTGAAGILTFWPFCKSFSFLPQNEPKLLQCYISWWAHAYLRKKYSSSNSVWPKKLGLLASPHLLPMCRPCLACLAGHWSEMRRGCQRGEVSERQHCRR